ncbi:50S ribosomal protein L6 [bacterium]|nr:50S ribosomal protein L6 [bacterium]NBX77911.1 50S ribosomal protein L6 [bacterium]
MSKIGKQPIATQNLTIEIKGNDVVFKGAKSSGSYALPDFLRPVIKDDKLFIEYDETKKSLKEGKQFWGLHRALLANKLKGAKEEFTKRLNIIGLGFKAEASGAKMTFSLGFSHKIFFNLPTGVTVEVDKTGQILTFKSTDKFLVGDVCQKIRAMRPPEPYKGTGIRVEGEYVRRKEGKTKGA